MHNGTCGKSMCVPAMIAKILLIVGGLNWGLVGIGMFMGTDLNLVHLIFGSLSAVEAIVYILVGAGAVMKLVGCKCKKCMAGCTCDSSATSAMGGGMKTEGMM